MLEQLRKEDEWFDLFLEDIGEPDDCDKNMEKIEEVIGKYKDKLPEQLFTYWRVLGWCSYGKGLIWMVNPDDYQNILDNWLSQTVFSNRKNLSVIARNAFGRLYIWDKSKGEIFKISPELNSITYLKERDENNNFSEDEENLEIQKFFGNQEKEYLDLEDDNDKFLFDKALKKLGRLKEDEAYGFKLHASIGGGFDLKNLHIVKLEIYHDISMQMAPIEWIILD